MLKLHTQSALTRATLKNQKYNVENQKSQKGLAFTGENNQPANADLVTLLGKEQLKIRIKVENVEKSQAGLQVQLGKLEENQQILWRNQKRVTDLLLRNQRILNANYQKLVDLFAGKGQAHNIPPVASPDSEMQNGLTENFTDSTALLPANTQELKGLMPPDFSQDSLDSFNPKELYDMMMGRHTSES